MQMFEKTCNFGLDALLVGHVVQNQSPRGQAEDKNTTLSSSAIVPPVLESWPELGKHKEKRFYRPHKKSATIDNSSLKFYEVSMANMGGLLSLEHTYLVMCGVQSNIFVQLDFTCLCALAVLS
jgi:hypothetical protein